jgi:Zinc knuckle
MVDERKWGPAGNVVDKGKAPEINALQAEINALKLSIEKNNKCHNCGKEGHVIVDCKEPKRDNKSGAKGAKGGQKRVEKGWRAIKPKPNATVHNQRTGADGKKTDHYFCRTCDQWCKHVAPEDSSKNPGIPVHSADYRRNKDATDKPAPAKPEANLIVFEEAEGVPYYFE